MIEHQVINYVFEPEAYQHCTDEPAPPHEGATNGDWMENHEAVRDAGADCRQKVNDGREWQYDKRRKVEGPSQSEPATPSLWNRLWTNKATPNKNPD